MDVYIHRHRLLLLAQSLPPSSVPARVPFTVQPVWNVPTERSGRYTCGVCTEPRLAEGMLERLSFAQGQGQWGASAALVGWYMRRSLLTCSGSTCGWCGWRTWERDEPHAAADMRLHLIWFKLIHTQNNVVRTEHNAEISLLRPPICSAWVCLLSVVLPVCVYIKLAATRDGASLSTFTRVLTVLE